MNEQHPTPNDSSPTTPLGPQPQFAQQERPAPSTPPAPEQPHGGTAIPADAPPAPPASQPAAAGQPAASAPPARPRPRSGVIVWGVLVLAFCGYITQRVFGSGELDTDWWIAATAIGLGVVLLGVSVAIAARGARTPRR